MARITDVPRATSAMTIAVWVLAVLATLFFLREAKSLLIPIALAVLISYALEPVVAWLERRRVPRLAAAAAVLFVILGVGALGVYTLRDDAAQLVESLPRALQRARDVALAQLGPNTAEAVKDGLGAGGGESASTGVGNDAPAGGSGGSLLQQVVSTLFAGAGHAVVIVFLVLFLLISGHHVRNRIVEISGPDQERKRTVATIIDDINAQIQRYLLVLVVTASIVATATWLVLMAMGVRQAPLWGVLAGVFNSIPYFGPVIVSGGLFLVGVTQGGGVTQGLEMAAAALVITSLEGWLITPPLMGRAERMSALAVFLGLLLWTWVWGGWGTILAVPMLVTVKSVADHVDRLRPIGRLMAP
jgi:predicted PurR-regulated permease PerM